MRGLLAAAIAVVAIPSAIAPARAAEHFDTGEVATLIAVPAAVLWLGATINERCDDQPPRWQEPPAIDRWVAIHLAPAPQPTRANFMDTDLAAALDVLASGAAVGWLDATYPRGTAGRDFLQGQLLYWSGYATLQGLQLGAKGLVGRERPLWYLAPAVAAQRREKSAGYSREAFWSGHASAAFYGATFLNLRARAVLRRELSSSAYGGWRWAPPAALFTWATWVAYSRIHAHQHYLTDVLVGAGVGTAFALLFASLDDANAAARTPERSSVPLVTIALPF